MNGLPAPDAGHQRFLDGAAALDLSVEVIDRAPANSLEEAADILGITPADIVKSLVLRHKDGSYFFALIPGDRQISWPKLRTLLSVNKVSMPPPADALAATGYERGTITPIGSSTAWPVYADERIQGKRVSMGAGAHGKSVFVDADQLIAALGATAADISE